MSQYDSEQLDRLEPTYLHSYGLAEPPFSPTRDERFIYLDSERTQRLNLLQHLTQYSDLLSIVSGERGSGKTSLMQQFVQRADQDWRICQIDATPLMSVDQLILQMARGFGLQSLPANPADQQQALYDHLLVLKNRNQVPILIIDDAHDLPEDSLEALFQLADMQAADDHLLRIILFCEPEIEQRLQHGSLQALRDRITHTMEIPALGEEQIAEYLRHRMHVAGFRGSESPFTPRIVKRISKSSHGIPERVNQLAHTVLRDGKVEQIETHVEEEPRVSSYPVHLRRALPILLVGILAGIGLAYQEDINQLFDDSSETVALISPVETEQDKPADSGATESPAVDTQPTSDAAPQEPGQQEETTTRRLEFEVTGKNTLQLKTPEPDPVPAPQSEPAATSPPVPVNESSQPLVPENASLRAEKAPPQPDKQSEKAPDEKPVQETRATPLRIDSIVPSPVTGSRKQQILKLRGDGFNPDMQVSVRWGKNTKVLPAERIRILNRHEMTFRISTGISADKWTVKLINRKDKQETAFEFAVIAPEAKPKGVAENGRSTPALTSADWWLKQDPKAFTIQLLSSKNEKAIRDFIARHKLAGETGYLRTSDTVFTLIHGVYPDRVSAQKAVQAYPASLRRSKPWVRQLGDVQKQVKTTDSSPGAGALAPAINLPNTEKAGPVAIPDSPQAQVSWLWSQDPTHFTLQLLGSQQEASIRDFIRRHQLSGKSAYFKTQQNGKDWFALIYGAYPDRDAALAARSKLPANLRKAAPWIRSFASIHAELKPQDAR